MKYPLPLIAAPNQTNTGVGINMQPAEDVVVQEKVNTPCAPTVSGFTINREVTAIDSPAVTITLTATGASLCGYPLLWDSFRAFSVPGYSAGRDIPGLRVTGSPTVVGNVTTFTFNMVFGFGDNPHETLNHYLYATPHVEIPGKGTCFVHPPLIIPLFDPLICTPIFSSWDFPDGQIYVPGGPNSLRIHFNGTECNQVRFGITSVAPGLINSLTPPTIQASGELNMYVFYINGEFNNLTGTSVEVQAYLLDGITTIGTPFTFSD